jgi:hypothetical protein
MSNHIFITCVALSLISTIIPVPIQSQTRDVRQRDEEYYSYITQDQKNILINKLKEAQYNSVPGTENYLSILRSAIIDESDKDYSTRDISIKGKSNNSPEIIDSTPLIIDSDQRYRENFMSLYNDSISGERIIGGLPTKLYSDAVAILPAVGDNNLCSGVLISQNALLTAGHCQCDGVNRNIKLGWNLGIPGRTRRIESSSIKIRFDCRRYVSGDSSILPGKDIALFFLTEPVPSTLATPRRIASWGMINRREITSVRAVGFGLDELHRFGVKRHVDIAIVSKRCDSPSAGSDDQKYGCVPDRELVAQSPRFYRDTCDGDSGGPIYVAGTDMHWYLAGITSRAIDGGICGDGGIYTLISDDVLNWIRQNGVNREIGLGPRDTSKEEN